MHPILALVAVVVLVFSCSFASGQTEGVTNKTRGFGRSRRNLTKIKSPKIAFSGGSFLTLRDQFLKFQQALKDGTANVSTPVQIESVTIGYVGGWLPNPTYTNVTRGGSGHSEAVEIKYSAQLKYHLSVPQALDDILHFFYTTHDPTSRDRQGDLIGTQYRSAIYVVSRRQVLTCNRVKKDVQKQFERPIVTELVEYSRFWPEQEKDDSKLLKIRNETTKVVSETLEKRRARFRGSRLRSTRMANARSNSGDGEGVTDAATNTQNTNETAAAVPLDPVTAAPNAVKEFRTLIEGRRPRRGRRDAEDGGRRRTAKSRLAKSELEEDDWSNARRKGRSRLSRGESDSTEGSSAASSSNSTDPSEEIKALQKTIEELRAKRAGRRSKLLREKADADSDEADAPQPRRKKKLSSSAIEGDTPVLKQRKKTLTRKSLRTEDDEEITRAPRKKRKQPRDDQGEQQPAPAPPVVAEEQQPAPPVVAEEQQPAPAPPVVAEEQQPAPAPPVVAEEQPPAPEA